MAVFLYILSVNLDSIGVGISYGLRKIHITTAAGIVIAMFSVICFGLSLYLGALLTTALPSSCGRYLASIILLVLGIWICVTGFCDRKPHKIKTERTFSIRSLGITISIMRDPTLCDFDASSRIDIREAIYLALALSLDSVAVGFSAGLSGIVAWYLPPLVGVSQFLFLIFGKLIGSSLLNISKVPHEVWTIVSGILLIILAIVHAL